MSQTWEPSNKSFQGNFREFQISHETCCFFLGCRRVKHTHTHAYQVIYICYMIIYIYNTPVGLQPTYPIHFCCSSHDFLVSAKNNDNKIWVFPRILVPPKWMVKIMKNPIKMDDLGGKIPLFLVQHPYPERTSGCGAFAMATLDVHHHSFGKTQAVSSLQGGTVPR